MNDQPSTNLDTLLILATLFFLSLSMIESGCQQKQLKLMLQNVDHTIRDIDRTIAHTSAGVDELVRLQKYSSPTNGLSGEVGITNVVVSNYWIGQPVTNYLFKRKP